MPVPDAASRSARPSRPTPDAPAKMAPIAARRSSSSTSRGSRCRPSRWSMRTARAAPDQYEVIGEKITYRLTQRPAATRSSRSVARGQDQGQRADPLCAGPGPQCSRTAAPMSASPPGCWWISLPGTCRSIASISAWRPPASASAGPGSPRSARKSSACWRRSTRPNCLDPRESRQGHGRDADQGRSLRARQDAHRLLLADLRRARRGVLPVPHLAIRRLCQQALGLKPAPTRCC